MKSNRDEVFAYVFSKADEVGYMGLDSVSSGKFQDELENDPELIKIAGNKLSRNYIKDTILNNYSKKNRYISEDDVIGVFPYNQLIDAKYNAKKWAQRHGFQMNPEDKIETIDQ